MRYLIKIIQLLLGFFQGKEARTIIAEGDGL